MKFIKAEWNSEWRGFWTDPSGYLEELPRIADELPKGARAFASDPGHYDFGSPRCVKDLRPIGTSMTVDGDAGFEISFSPNEWKHESGLVIRYGQVSKLCMTVDESGSNVDDLGTVLLDEILPAARGCSHEIVFTGGLISIFCADINARWG